MDGALRVTAHAPRCPRRSMTRQTLRHAATADLVQCLTPLRCPALPSVSNLGSHSVAFSVWYRVSGLRRVMLYTITLEDVVSNSGHHNESAVMLQVRQGYVHVWGDSSPRSHIDAAAKPPMLVPELDPDTESAVLRDGSEPLHAGKRYLRGTTITIRLTMDDSVLSVRGFCMCKRFSLNRVFRCSVGAALLVCLVSYSLVQSCPRSHYALTEMPQQRCTKRTLASDCLSTCMALERF